MKRWFFATRPWSFVVSATPVVATTLFLLYKYGCGNINWINAILALTGIIIFHAAANVHSDYYDYKTGIDNKDAYCIQSLINGDFTPQQYLNLSRWLLAVGIVIGLVLTLLSGWPLLVIGAIGCMLILIYPWTKFHALGDLDIFLTFGILPMLGTAYVTTGTIDWSTLLLSIPVGAITVAVLHANNTRDIPTDSAAGAKSFAKVIGERASMWWYIILSLIPSVYTIAAVIAGVFPWWCLLVLLSLPIAIKNAGQALRYRTDGLCAFNQLDLMSARQQMISGITLCLGFILGAIF
ncbi:MAG: prenyltransferase [Bacteroidales bacterium]|nr:prenyltransferase [Bacteroidales bacterium]